jgi:hypothetical protein
MTVGEMTKALQVYIQTFKIFGADITYCTDDGILLGSMVIPAGQFCVDEFAAKLEFFECEKDGVSVVRLVDGTGCVIRTVNPENGRDMLKMLRIMLPPKTVTLDTKVNELLDLLRRVLVKVGK